MKDRTITVTWCEKSQTYDIVGEHQEGDGVHQGELLLLSLTMGEMQQFYKAMHDCNIKKAKEAKNDTTHMPRV